MISKMLVVDLDQTVLHNDKSLSLNMKQTLSAWAETGKLVIATGRGLERSVDLARQLHAQGIVTLNGSMVYENEQAVAKTEIDAGLTRQLISGLLDLPDTRVVVVYPTKILGTEPRFIESGWCQPLNMDSFEAMEIQKIFCFTPHHEFWEHFDAEAVGCRVILDKEDPDCRIILNEKVNKLEGVKVLAERWGIQLSEVTAFGDDFNDLELLQGCGWGVAVENALAEVKAAVMKCVEAMKKTVWHNG